VGNPAADDDPQVRDPGILDDVGHGRRPVEGLGQPELVLEAEQRVQPGPAHVGRDQHHALAGSGQRDGQVRCRSGLALAAHRAGEQDDLDRLAG
jgi:hypothetical protein